MKRSSGEVRACGAPEIDDANRDPPGQMNRENLLPRTSRETAHDRIHDESSEVATQEETIALRSGGDRNWSARIKASIARLLEIEGIGSDPDTYSKTIEAQKTRSSSQTFQERVDLVEAESKDAHKMYWDRLHDLYSSTSTKKMRMTTTTTTTTTAAPPTQKVSSATHRGHEALETLVMAAATDQFSQLAAPTTDALKTTTNTHEELKSYKPSQGEEDSGRHSVAVHDPAIVKAVDKLNGKLAELLSQVQTTTEVAVPEPILASAATIASEAEKMRQCEEVAMGRMIEIEEQREKVMQGLLEYAQRKEKRETEGKSKDSAV